MWKYEVFGKLSRNVDIDVDAHIVRHILCAVMKETV